jgi:hypothetical protein
VAQGEGPELKPQYQNRQKKKKKKLKHVHIKAYAPVFNIIHNSQKVETIQMTAN